MGIFYICCLYLLIGVVKSFFKATSVPDGDIGYTENVRERAADICSKDYELACYAEARRFPPQEAVEFLAPFCKWTSYCNNTVIQEHLCCNGDYCRAACEGKAYVSPVMFLIPLNLKQILNLKEVQPVLTGSRMQFLRNMPDSQPIQELYPALNELYYKLGPIFDLVEEKLYPSMKGLREGYDTGDKFLIERYKSAARQNYKMEIAKILAQEDTVFNFDRK